MTSNLQRTFDRQLAVERFRPVVGMDGAKHLLDLGEDQLIALIEEGHLSYAWNIGLGDERREVRILRASIDHYLAHGSKKPHGLTDEEAFALLLPPGFKVQLASLKSAFLTNPQLQRTLNCTSDHVLHLVEAGDLALLPGTAYKRGPAGYALVTVASFKRFITNRRLP